MEVTMFRSFASTASSLTLAAVGSLLLCSGVKPAQAQSNRSYSVNIPFAFQMNDALLPAGAYHITQVSPHSLRLSEVGGKHAGYVQVFPGDDAPNEKAQIRFTRYGKDSFLKDFSTASNGSPHRSVNRCSITQGEKRAVKDWVQTKQSFTTVALNTYPQR
jgi:hypothetical protein